MFPVLIDFANVFLAALTGGALFCVWLVMNPKGLAADSYVAMQQQGIRTLNHVMPPLGAATIVMTLLAAAVGRRDAARFALLILTAICFAAAGFITRFLNQPINTVVMTWSSAAPPANWVDLRDAWWKWHLVRLAAGLAGLGLVIAATLQHGGRA